MRAPPRRSHRRPRTRSGSLIAGQWVPTAPTPTTAAWAPPVEPPARNAAVSGMRPVQQSYRYVVRRPASALMVSISYQVGTMQRRYPT